VRVLGIHVEVLDDRRTLTSTDHKDLDDERAYVPSAFAPHFLSAL